MLTSFTDDDEDLYYGTSSSIENYIERAGLAKTQKPKKKPGCWAHFKGLRESPRDLWALYVLTFFDSVSYFIFSYVLLLHLTEELHYNDQMAGVIYGVFGVCISVFAILLGGVADRLRVRKTLVFTAILSAGCRFFMSFIPANLAFLSALIMFLPFSFSVGLESPAIPTGIRRYTTDATSDFAFSIFYIIMNVGAVVSAPLVDIIRIQLPENGTVMGFTPHRFLIFLSALLEVVQLLIAWIFIRDVDMQEDGSVEKLTSMDEGETPTWKERWETWKTGVKNILVLRNFWRFIVLSSCLVWVKATFRYMDSLYPLYIPRAFENSHDVPYMSLLGLNPAIVIALTVPATAVIRNFHPITAITIGSVLSGLSPFFMAIGAHWWAVVCFIILLSLGEIIWSPISYDYTCKLAPKEQEGMFFALSGVPMFGAKLITGPLSGFLLTRFCPVDATPETCNSFFIWGIIGFTTIISPFGLLITRKFITVPLGTPLEEVELEQTSVGLDGVEIDVTETDFS